MAYQYPDVDPQAVVDCIEVLRYSFPAPLGAGTQRLNGDRLDAGEHLSEGVLVVGPGGCEGEATVAHDDTGHTVVAGGGAEGVPGDLGVVMGMVVDEARGDSEAGGVDGPMGGAGRLADLHDLAILHGDVASKRWL